MSLFYATCYALIGLALCYFLFRMGLRRIGKSMGDHSNTNNQCYRRRK